MIIEGGKSNLLTSVQQTYGCDGSAPFKSLDAAPPSIYGSFLLYKLHPVSRSCAGQFAGTNPVSRVQFAQGNYAAVAQLAEHQTSNLRAAGSSPVRRSTRH